MIGVTGIFLSLIAISWCSGWEVLWLLPESVRHFRMVSLWTRGVRVLLILLWILKSWMNNRHLEHFLISETFSKCVSILASRWATGSGTLPIVLWFVSNGDVVCIYRIIGVLLFTLDWGCRQTFATTTRRPHWVPVCHINVSLWRRGVCRRSDVRYSCIRSLIWSGVSLWTEGVVSTDSPVHWLDGYSLLTGGVITSLLSSVFTLD